MDCACGSGKSYTNCCEPFHLNKENAPTAEALMRSRYSAFVFQNADYLYETTDPLKRKGNSRKAYLDSAKNTKWVKLEILFSAADVVEFKAYYLGRNFNIEILHEKSNFRQENDKWFYVDGTFY